MLENKKKLGVINTPSHISDWIVKLTFQQNFARTLNLSSFTIKDVDSLDHKKTELLMKYIGNIKILDIAVGCGTFYISSLKYLLRLYSQLGLTETNYSAIIKNILTTNLYGLEIDETALVVCKIRLLFELTEINMKIPLEEFEEIFRDIKLKIGNSLIGFVRNQTFDRTIVENNNFPVLFPYRKRNKEIDTSFFHDTKIFHWFIEFPEVFGKSKQNGFNIIIGNPPYIGYRNINKKEKQLLKMLYPDIYTGLNDYYYYFIWRAVQLLSANGSSALIIARYFLEARYARKLRQKLLCSNHVDMIIDFRRFKVFANAEINTAILFLSASVIIMQKIRLAIIKDLKLPIKTLLKELNHAINHQLSENNHNFQLYSIDKDYYKTNETIFASEAVIKIINKIEKNSHLLSHVCDIGTGYHSGKDMVFSKYIIKENGEYFVEITDNKENVRYPLEKSIMKRIVKSSDILSFTINSNNKFVILTKHGIDIERYPMTKHYLKQFKKILENRYEVRKNVAKWYEIAQIRNQRLFDAKIKIMCPYRTRVPRFSIDMESRYSSIDCTLIVPKTEKNISIYYILGILNSELIELYLYVISKKLDAEKIELYPKTLSKIPIKIGNTTYENSLIEEITKVTKFIYKKMDSIILTSNQKKSLINEGIKESFEFKRSFPEISSSMIKLNELVYRLYRIDDQKLNITNEIANVRM
ncbi:MAG: Eco57I restriction-modification methylase domain-containing protein [Candidatus Hodarchaeales archaeon]